MKIINCLLAAMLLGTSCHAVAADTPEDLECANIERAWARQVWNLKAHLEREMPPQLPVDEVSLKTLWLAGLGGLRGFDGVLHESSTHAYRSDIAQMIARGKQRGCDWTNGL